MDENKPKFEVVRGGDRRTPAPTAPGPAAIKPPEHTASGTNVPEPGTPQKPLSVQSGATKLLAILGLLPVLYFGKPVFITVLLSVLLAFILEPLVSLLTRLRLPRALASLIAMLVFAGVLYGASYASYMKAISFAHQLPKYSEKVRETFSKLRSRTQDLKNSTQQVLPKQDQNAVKVQQVETGWSQYFSFGSSVTEAVFSASFIPFMAFFMLTWQEHIRRAAVMLFARDSRTTAYVAVSNIADMLRRFIVGNVLIGLIVGGANALGFMALGIPYWYFVGMISGFLSLVPYLGVVLALVPPLVAGLGVLTGTKMGLVAAMVVASHLIALNVLYPKILGSRLEMNPLVVTFALLFWGFLWGAMGLILAIPVTAAIKIVLDHVNSLRPVAFLMGEGREEEPG